MEFVVKYSIKKDIDNYLCAVWDFRYLRHGRKNIQKKLLKFFPRSFKNALQKSTTKKEASLLIRDYLNFISLKFAPPLEIAIKYLQEVLNNEKDNIIHMLERLYTKPFPFKKIVVFITTLTICPYNYQEKWFMVSKYGSKSGHLKIVKHELNHFMFYYYFGYLKKELGFEKFESLKEALTVFTNPEEKGYPAQQKLRAWLAKQNESIQEIIKSNNWKNYL